MALIAVSRSALPLSTVMHDGVAARWRGSLVFVTLGSTSLESQVIELGGCPICPVVHRSAENGTFGMNRTGKPNRGLQPQTGPSRGAGQWWPSGPIR